MELRNMKRNDFSVAVLFTCFNRKEKTVRCVKSLLNQNSIPTFDLYVCDDGSTDGTAEAILEVYPNANIIQGTGNLFWSRGMHVVMKEAVQRGYDYYLMVNDDVEFSPSMWETIFEPYREGKKCCGVVGYTKSSVGEQGTYGGHKMVKSKMNYVIGQMVEIRNDTFATVDVANWNCFLVSNHVVEKVGLIDPYYEHGLGDYDYSLRMRKQDIEILVAKSFVGFCENNSKENTYLDGKVPRLKRMKLMLRPNGFPIKSWFYFVNKHYGIYKYRSAIMPYVKNVIAIILGRDIG